MPHANVQLREDILSGQRTPWGTSVTQAMADSNRKIRASSYVSCWHMNAGESEAMWRLYCGSSSGVALQTTYERLAASVDDDNVYIGLVRYADYDNDTIPSRTVFDPVMHKRAAFAHEREVRVLAVRGESRSY